MSTQLNPCTTRWRAHHVVLASVLAVFSGACAESTSPGFDARDLRGALEGEGEDASVTESGDTDGAVAEGQGMDPGMTEDAGVQDSGATEPTAPTEDGGVTAPTEDGGVTEPTEDSGVTEPTNTNDPDAGSVEEPAPSEPQLVESGDAPLLETQSAPLSFDTMTEIPATSLVASQTDWATPFFGNPVLVQGDRMLVGAWGDAEQAPQQGAAFLYERINGVWTFDTKLMASDANVESTTSGWGASYGYVMAMDGDTLAISAAWDDGDDGTLDVGAVYVYDLTAGSWIETKLRAPEPEVWGSFGESVAISGDWLFVRGTEMTGGRHHVIYVYHRGVSGWELAQELESPDGSEQRSFGYNMKVVGNDFFIWAERAPGNVGGWATHESAVYAYELVNGTWTMAQRIRPSDAEPGDGFGAIAYDGTTLVVGAPYRNDGFAYQGAAYIFTKQNGTWTEVASLREPTARRSWFGYHVAVDGPVIAIGTANADLNDIVYVYEYSTETSEWSMNHSVAVGPVAQAAQTYGYISMTMSGGELFLGLSEGTSNGNAWGAVYSLSGGSVQ